MLAEDKDFTFEKVSFDLSSKKNLADDFLQSLTSKNSDQRKAAMKKMDCPGFQTAGVASGLKKNGKKRKNP